MKGLKPLMSQALMTEALHQKTGSFDGLMSDNYRYVSCICFVIGAVERAVYDYMWHILKPAALLLTARLLCKEVQLAFPS